MGGSMNSLDRAVTSPDSGCEDVEDFQLNSTWNIYYLRNDKENWDERVVFIKSFSTVREFWAVYHYLKLPSRLQMGCDYMVFRDGIKPEWKDIKNEEGGRWILEIDRIYRNEQLDDKWLETLLALIGETLTSTDDNFNPQICGAIVQSRKKIDRVGHWNKLSKFFAADEFSKIKISKSQRKSKSKPLFPKLYSSNLITLLWS